MKLRTAIAQACGSASEWLLRNIFHRPAANFPGKAGLLVDPKLIGNLRPHLKSGSIIVAGTNGKTTVTNLLADAFEAAGHAVACNRTGANLDSGVASALLHTDGADWGIFEVDELWLPIVATQLKPAFVVLLNLFRDQLDRMGEIDHIQEAVARALSESPRTALIYNADDPFCQAIAERVDNERIPFGFDEDLGLVQNTVIDASICQRCDSLLSYEWRQYGQLGSFHCPNCGFKRVQPSYAASEASISSQGAAFTIRCGTATIPAHIPFSEAYMAYNALAVFTAADACGIAPSSIFEAIRGFAPGNGRLQSYAIQGRRILLNLAKNPTGFNQNLRIIAHEPGPKAAAFFINDQQADGHDVSWLWDVDFQELAGCNDLITFAGGIRKNDMQVRLKYAGIEAQLIDDAEDFLEKAFDASPCAKLFLIANYTALPEVKGALDLLARNEREGACSRRSPDAAPRIRHREQAVRHVPDGPRPHLSIVHLYPELLNLYGDGGNVAILAQRARARSIDIDIIPVHFGQPLNLDAADIVFLGGGPDREQRLASSDLLKQAEQLRAYVNDDGVLLAICGGYQILGREWLSGDETVLGLGILACTTKRLEGGSHNRLVGNIALSSPLASMPVIGYENHAGRTYLGKGCKPFGSVIGACGKGNNDEDGVDGILHRNVIGTYLHGPLLAKNPEVADWLIQRALDRQLAKCGAGSSAQALALMPLDDAAEHAANAFMCQRLNLHR